MKRPVRFSQATLSPDREAILAVDSQGQIWIAHFQVNQPGLYGAWAMIKAPEVEDTGTITKQFMSRTNK